MFDPYRDWLGISDERRPPTLYQLLGLTPTEADSRAIEAAASRQLAKVHSHIAGTYSKEAWRVVDEITLAKATLLDPVKRSAYDAVFGFSTRSQTRSPFPPPPFAAGPPGDSGWEQGHSFPTAPLPTAPFPTAPMPTAPFPGAAGRPPFFPPGGSAGPPMPTHQAPTPQIFDPFPQQAVPQGLFAPILRQDAPLFAPAPKQAPAAANVNFLEQDDPPRNDDSSSNGLPTPAGMPNLRGHKGKSSSLKLLVVGGILALAAIGVIIFLANRDKAPEGESKEIVDGKEKKGSGLNNPLPLDSNSKVVAKDPKKEAKDPKKDKTVVKKLPPKQPDPVPLPPEAAAEFKEPKLFRGHEATPRCVAVSPDGKLLLTAGDDMAVFTWSPTADKGAFRKNLNSPATGAAFMPNGKEILVADGGRIFLMDLATNKDTKTWTVPANNGSFNAFALSGDGKRMVTGMTIGKVLSWDLQKNDYDITMDATQMPVECVALTNDGSAVLAGGQDGSLSVFEGTGKLLKKWTGHPGGVAAVAFSPDGRLMGSAGVDKLVKIWDRQTFALLFTLKGHADVPIGVAWTSDSGMIVSAGVDKSIRAWDSVTGLPLRWTHTSEQKIRSLALDPKDRFLIAGLGDSGVQLVFLPTVRPDYPPRSTWVKAPATPQPIPLPFQIENAVKSLREKYKADFALTAAEDQQALYEKLMGRAKNAPDDPPSRFAQFQEARSLAIRLGRMEDAFKAIDAMAIWFEIDDLAEKATALKEAGKGTVSRAVVEAAANVIEQAEKLARIDVVDELLRQRELFPQLPDAADANAKIQAAEKRWTNAANDREAGKRLIADWMKDPENAGTNFAYGKHLCFRLGQWTEGLPRLLKGDDPTLKDLAKKDQASPKDGKSQLDLAVAWRDYADKADDMIKPGALLRAKFWYDQASRSADLTAGEKNSANARIGEINRQVEMLPNAPLSRGGVPVRRQQFNSIRNAVALETQWAFAGSDGLGPDGLLIKGEGTLVSRFRVLDACRVEFAFVPDGREISVQLNGETAAFKPALTTAIVFVIAERKGAKVTFSLKSFTGTMLDEKSGTLTAGKDDASAILFKVAAAPDKEGILMKSIVVNGMVRPVD